jgi:sugar O-acyltransferase (sialic acid O-acetyltransferase NeuD family)
MKKDLILLGGGGHCKSCIDVIEQEGSYKIIGILDVSEKVGSRILGYQIIGTDSDLPKYSKRIKNCFVTLGQIKSSLGRVRLYKLAKEAGFQFPSIISPHAYVSKSAFVGCGTIIMHHVLVNANAVIGENCILNSKSLIEHDSKIGNHCHISTASIINGGVCIGDGCFIGSNSVVKQYSIIPDNSFIQANSFYHQ